MNTNDLKNFTWDKSQIDVSDIYDMEYWSTLWGVSKEQIIDAIKKTGSNRVEIIKGHLV